MSDRDRAISIDQYSGPVSDAYGVSMFLAFTVNCFPNPSAKACRGWLISQRAKTCLYWFPERPPLLSLCLELELKSLHCDIRYQM